jgi:hypothetical protein
MSHATCQSFHGSNYDNFIDLLDPDDFARIRFLKRQSHEIFDLLFFHINYRYRPLINTLKYFRTLFRIRGATRL